MFKKSLFLFFLSFSHIASAQDAPVGNPGLATPNPMAGDWVMHIYIGSRVFNDELRLTHDAAGNLTGTLTVPGVFTANVFDFQTSGAGFSFKITIDEGRGPQTLLYSGILHPSRQSFVGFASSFDSGALVGGFVGQPTLLPKLNP